MGDHPRSRATLIPPPKPLPNASPIETLLHLHHLKDISPTTFTNAYPLWRPPGARGLYGGAAIAQSLGAAQATIPPNFVVHSMHSYFVMAGDSDIPVIYEVEKVRDGRSFATRAVQTRQRGRCICMTMISFTREQSGGEVMLEHQSSMPLDPELPREDSIRAPGDKARPFETVLCKPTNEEARQPGEKTLRQWMRARGKISDRPATNDHVKSGVETPNTSENHQAHVCALAYISDSWFLATVPIAHNMWKLPLESNSEDAATSKDTNDNNASASAAAAAPPPPPPQPQKQLGMMVSLDHSIFFHNPTKFRADEWMLSEMTTPWAGEGRGFVSQNIWSKDGALIATCTQEGVLRLKQEPEPEPEPEREPRRRSNGGSSSSSKL